MPNKKIVIDTNVLISALIGKGYSKQILKEIFINRDLLLCISNPCLEEFEKVLDYKHLKKYPSIKADGEILLEEIKTFGIIYYPSAKLTIIKDKSDNKFLELALAAKADYLITGNKLHFTQKEYLGTKIRSPKEFWDELQKL